MIRRRATRTFIVVARVGHSMVREKKIRLSDEEHRRLSEYREEQFGGDDVPFGFVISDLLDKVGDGE